MQDSAYDIDTSHGDGVDDACNTSNSDHNGGHVYFGFDAGFQVFDDPVQFVQGVLVDKARSGEVVVEHVDLFADGVYHALNDRDVLADKAQTGGEAVEHVGLFPDGVYHALNDWDVLADKAQTGGEAVGHACPVLVGIYPDFHALVFRNDFPTVGNLETAH